MLSHVQLSETPWTVVHQAPLSMEFSRHEEFSRILEWVAIPFSRGSSWPRDWTWVSHTAGRFFTTWATSSSVLVYLCLIILFSFSHLSCPKTLPNMLVQLFPKMDSTTQTCGSLGITCHGAATPPFCTHVCCQGSFLDLRKLLHVISLLQQSSAFATSFVLGISEGKQSFSCTPIDKHQLSSPGVHLFPTSVLTNIFLCDCFWLCPQPRSPLHSSGQDLQPHHASSL